MLALNLLLRGASSAHCRGAVCFQQYGTEKGLGSKILLRALIGCKVPSKIVFGLDMLATGDATPHGAN